MLREWRAALVSDLGGEETISAQQRVIVEIATGEFHEMKQEREARHERAVLRDVCGVGGHGFRSRVRGSAVRAATAESLPTNTARRIPMVDGLIGR